MLHAIATIHIKPEHIAAASVAMCTLAGKSLKEHGCKRYAVFQRQGEPVLVTQETWVDAAAEAAHMAGPHVAAAFAAIGALLSAPPEVHRYTQLTA